MKISKSKLQKLIRSEIVLKSPVSERKERGSAKEGGPSGVAAGTTGPQSGKDANWQHWDLQPRDADSVVTPQNISLAVGSQADIDLGGVSNEEDFHDFIKALITADVFGDGGSVEFQPWQPWQSAGHARSRTIHFTLVNNVIPYRDNEGVPNEETYGNPNALGVIIRPVTFNTRTTSAEEAAAGGEGGSSGESSGGLTDAIKQAIRGGVSKMVEASPGGTDEPMFDRGLKQAIEAVKRASRETEEAKAYADQVTAELDDDYDTVSEMIYGEWDDSTLGMGEDEYTHRIEAWRNLSTSWPSFQSESIKKGTLPLLSPKEVWNWVILEQNEEAAEVAVAEEIDLDDVSEEVYETFVTRVQAVLTRFPKIGWGVTDTAATIPEGVNEASYFFIKEYGNSEDEQELYTKSANALIKYNNARTGRAGVESQRRARGATRRRERGERREREAERAAAGTAAVVPQYGRGSGSTAESRVRKLVRDALLLELKKKNNLTNHSSLKERKDRGSAASGNGSDSSGESGSSNDEIESGGGTVGGNIELIKQEMDSQGITNRLMRLAILGVIGKESGFIPQVEKGYSGTSNARIRMIFGDRVSRQNLPDGKTLDQLKADDEAFFNHVYGPEFYSKYGNVDPEDGYKYRGRGFNQITFRGTYKKYGLEGDPESLNDPATAARVAVEFLAKRLDRIGGRDQEPESLNSAVEKAAQANAGLGKKGSALSRARDNTRSALRKFFRNEPEVSELA